MRQKISVTNKFLSPMFSIILLAILLVFIASVTGCKSRKNSNDNNLSELTSEVENKSNIDNMSAEGKMYAITNSWYKYKTVNKLVTEVYEKDQLVVKNEYDSDGYRIKKTADDTVTNFKYDKEYQLITEVCISNKTGTHTLKYTYELQYSDVKGPKYKLTGFTYNGHNYTFKMTDDGRGIITAIYEGGTCVAEYEMKNSLLKAVYEFKNGEKVKNDDPDFIGNLNRVLSENEYYYDDETGMFINKDLRWYSSYGNMSYYEREYETLTYIPIVWTPSNGDKYVYNDNGDIERIVNNDEVLAEYKYEQYADSSFVLTEKISGSNVVKYDYFTGNEDIAKGEYFWSDLYIAKNSLTEQNINYNDLKSKFSGKLKSISTIINGKEYKLIYKYGYPIEDKILGEGFGSLEVSGFSYNGKNYKFEFAVYDSSLITGIIDDKGNKLVSYKIENEGGLYYNRKTYELKNGVEVENNSPDFIGNLNLIVCDKIIYDTDCGVNFNAIRYKR